MAKLQSVIDRVRRKIANESEWLYIVGSAQQLSLETEADRGFCDKLGSEILSTRCRHDGCKLGIVKFSMLCRTSPFRENPESPLSIR